MKRRKMLAGAGPIAAGAMLGLPAPSISQGIRQLKMVTDWSADHAGPAPDFRYGWRRRSATRRRAHQDRGLSRRRARARVPNLRRGRGRRRRHVSFLRGLFRAQVAGIQFLRDHALRPHRRRTLRVGPAWRRPGVVGRAQRTVQRQAAPVRQHRLPDGRVVHPRDRLGGGVQGIALPHGRSRAEVLRRLGAVVVSLPGGEITAALRSGAIDASEWIGPWLDMAMGLHKSAKYYYYPGFHEPGAGWSLGFNRSVWDSLAASDRRLIEVVAAAEYMVTLSEFNASNARAANAARGQHDQDPEIRRRPAEGTASDQHGGRRRSRRRRRDVPEDSTPATRSSANWPWRGATSPSASTRNGSALAPGRGELRVNTKQGGRR